MADAVQDTLGGMFARPPLAGPPLPRPRTRTVPRHPGPVAPPIAGAPVDGSHGAPRHQHRRHVRRRRATGDNGRSVAGMPFQLIDGTGPLTERSTSSTGLAAVNVSVAVDVAVRRRPTVTVPVDMPPVLRREGDPLGAWDCHAYSRPSLQPARGDDHRRLVPAWSASHDGSGRGVVEWDLGRPSTLPDSSASSPLASRHAALHPPGDSSPCRDRSVTPRSSPC